jgi:hypothetical protein
MTDTPNIVQILLTQTPRNHRPEVLMLVFDCISKSCLDKHTIVPCDRVMPRRRLRSLYDKLLTVRPPLTRIAAALACVVRHLNVGA